MKKPSLNFFVFVEDEKEQQGQEWKAERQLEKSVFSSHWRSLSLIFCFIPDTIALLIDWANACQYLFFNAGRKGNNHLLIVIERCYAIDSWFESTFETNSIEIWKENNAISSRSRAFRHHLYCFVSGGSHKFVFGWIFWATSFTNRQF